MSTHPISAAEIPQNPFHRRAWVLYQLQLRGLGFIDLASEAGVVSSAIQNVFSHPNVHLETFVAEKLGLTAQELFPERFDADGNRIVRTREQSRSRPLRRPARRKVRD